MLLQGLLRLVRLPRTKLRKYQPVAKTAEALLIHRSSLLKRLDKIYRLLGSMLDTPEERLYLRLCLELLQRTNREAL